MDSQTDKFGDLHTHTAHSREENNFLNTRLQNYARAKSEMPGLVIVGITDHDTLNYLEPMYRAQKLFNQCQLPLLLPGIEMTSAFEHPTDKARPVMTHVLGYFPRLVLYNEQEIGHVNSALEASMSKVIRAKLKKEADLRLGHFFKAGIIPSSYSFDGLREKVLAEYEVDRRFVDAQEPKTGDIINWPLTFSYKLVSNVLLKEGIAETPEEVLLYADRINDARIARLAEILAKREGISAPEALEKSKRLQGSCHGSYRDDFYKLSTQEAIALISNAGGIPILAHPMVSLKDFKTSQDDFFAYCERELIPIGLKGMEAFYPKQNHLTPAIIDFCDKHNLYITGGSDDHQDGRNHVGEPDSRCPVENIFKMIGAHK